MGNTINSTDFVKNEMGAAELEIKNSTIKKDHSKGLLLRNNLDSRCFAADYSWITVYYSAPPDQLYQEFLKIYIEYTIQHGPVGKGFGAALKRPSWTRSSD